MNVDDVQVFVWTCLFLPDLGLGEELPGPALTPCVEPSEKQLWLFPKVASVILSTHRQPIRILVLPHARPNLLEPLF